MGRAVDEGMCGDGQDEVREERQLMEWYIREEGRLVERYIWGKER